MRFLSSSLPIHGSVLLLALLALPYLFRRSLAGHPHLQHGTAQAEA